MPDLNLAVNLCCLFVAVRKYSNPPAGMVGGSGVGSGGGEISSDDPSVRVKVSF